ncbi:MAG: hypothetical protein HYV63_32955 [Candidatus Schekmanbacteria bacterium]|nr:hypothetical protein [Candidatus Schekmanbacteria bacterium]
MFAYAHLNLRENPFGELQNDERAGVAVADVEELAACLAASRCAVQLLGAKGTGKTTHLLALKRFFPRAPYVHVAEGERPAIPRGNPLFLDEAQRLPRWRRWTLFRCRGALALASHIDHTAELQAAGYCVHTMVPAELLTTARLSAIFRLRLEHARRSGGPLPAISDDTVQSLKERFGNDVRAMEFALYEAIRRMEGAEDVVV